MGRPLDRNAGLPALFGHGRISSLLTSQNVGPLVGSCAIRARRAEHIVDGGPSAVVIAGPEVGVQVEDHLRRVSEPFGNHLDVLAVANQEACVEVAQLVEAVAVDEAEQASRRPPCAAECGGAERQPFFGGEQEAFGPGAVAPEVLRQRRQDYVGQGMVRGRFRTCFTGPKIG